MHYMIIYIYGEDTFQSSGYLKQTIERFKKERDPQGLNVVVLDGQKEEAGRFWDEITAAPFLAERRMVVVKNVLSNKNSDILDALAEGVKNKKAPEKNVAVFWQGEPIGKSKSAQELHKTLAKEKWAKEFKILSEAELAGWIKMEAAKRGGRINARAVSYLSENVGNDMWHLNSLLDQLVAYVASFPLPLPPPCIPPRAGGNGDVSHHPHALPCLADRQARAGGEEITLSDAQLFLEEKVDDSIFNMVDAIIAGNRKLAFKLLQKQRRMGEDESHLFAMILRQFRILIEMRDLFNRGENMASHQIAAELGLHPFVVKKSLPLMKRYSLERLKKVYTQLLDIDIKTKTGQGDQSLLIDLFVNKL